VTDTDQEITLRLPDNGGRRSGIERRRFQYTSHIPERRSGHDRRSGIDRRTLERRQDIDRRAGFVSSADLAGE
jgi:hypothetical protein